MSLIKDEKDQRLVLVLPKKVKHELKVLAAFDNQPIGKIALSFLLEGIEKNQVKLARAFGNQKY